MKKSRIICILLICLILSVSCGCGMHSSKGEEALTEPTTEAKREAAESDWDYIHSNGELRVGYVEFMPMNYYNENGEFVGFDTELATEVAKALGLKISFVPINWDTHPLELETKNIDCVWNAMCITEERKQHFALSDGYLYDKQSMVVRAQDQEAILENNSAYVVTAEEGAIGEGKIDGSMINQTSADDNSYEFFYNDTYQPSITMADALTAVSEGTADIALVDSTIAEAQCGPGKTYENLVICQGIDFGQEMYGVCFRYGSDMIPIINEQIEKLYEDGTMKALAKKYHLEEKLVR